MKPQRVNMTRFRTIMQYDKYFGTTGGTSHSENISGLIDGGSYSYYVRCEDTWERQYR